MAKHLGSPNVKSLLCVLAVLSLGVVGDTSLVFSQARTGQFGLPPLPETSKRRDKKKTKDAQPKEGGPSEIAESPQDTPELSQIAPDSVPRGATGEFVLTGKNFYDGMTFLISCKEGEDPDVQSVKVENPTRAIARIRVPRGTKEGTCTPYLQYKPGPPFTIATPLKKP